MYDEITTSIDNIDEVVLESEMDCLLTLCNVYEKQMLLMEYIDDVDTVGQIIQEGVFRDALDETKEQLKGKNAIVKVLTFIFRYIGNLFKMIFKKNNRVEKRCEAIKQTVKQVEETFEEVNKTYSENPLWNGNKLNMNADAIKNNPKIANSPSKDEWQSGHNKSGTNLIFKPDGIYVGCDLNFDLICEFINAYHDFMKQSEELADILATSNDANQIQREIASKTESWNKMFNSYTDRIPSARGETSKNDFWDLYIFSKRYEMKAEEYSKQVDKVEKLLKDTKQMYDKHIKSQHPFYTMNPFTSETCKSIDPKTIQPLRMIAVKLSESFSAFYAHADRYFEHVFGDLVRDVAKMKQVLQNSNTDQKIVDAVNANLKANDQMSKDVKDIGKSIDEAEKKNPGLKQALADVL
jgi:hypothetical protein